MKKLLIALFALILCLPSCGESIPPDVVSGEPFLFYYETDKKICFPRETVTIVAYVEANILRPYKYSGTSSSYLPEIELCPVLDDGSLGTPLEYEYISLPEDTGEHLIKPNDIGSMVYKFTIPEGAYGKYNMKLSFEGVYAPFPDVLEVINPAQQNESDKYRYSNTLVSSGEYGIKPIQGLIWTTQYENGEPTLEGDGGGVYDIISDSETDRNSFPTLVLTEELKITPPEHVSADGGSIYPIDSDPYADGTEKHPLSDASKLPAGEYIVIFQVYSDTRNGNESIKDYWKTCFECLFKLVVPEKHVDYNYSAVSLSSGNGEIAPILCYVGTTAFKSGNVVSADDGGGSYFFFAGHPDHTTFPTLILDGGISVRQPVHYYIGNIRVFDTKFNDLEKKFDSFDELSQLPAGEYIVVYYEQYTTNGCSAEITDYEVIENEGVFKLIVPER